MGTRTLTASLGRAGEHWDDWTSGILDGNLWYAKVAAVVAAVSLFVQAPLYSHAVNFENVVRQSKHPLKNLVAAPGSHAGKLVWRMVPALLIRLTNLTPGPYMALQALLGVATFAMLAVVLERSGLSRSNTLLVVLGVGTTYAGAVFFVDASPYFDAIAVFLLVAAMAVRNPAWMFVALSVAMWTDERCIASAFIVAAFHAVSERGRSAYISTISAALMYAAVRVVMSVRYELVTDRAGTGLGVVHDFLRTSPIALILSLEGLWIVIVAGITAGLVRRDPNAVVVVAAVAGLSLGALGVGDVTRGAIFILPAIGFGAIWLAQETTAFQRRICTLTAVLCVVVPTTFAIAPNITWIYPLPLRMLPG